MINVNFHKSIICIIYHTHLHLSSFHHRIIQESLFHHSHRETSNFHHKYQGSKQYHILNFLKEIRFHMKRSKINRNHPRDHNCHHHIAHTNLPSHYHIRVNNYHHRMQDPKIHHIISFLTSSRFHIN